MNRRRQELALRREQLLARSDQLRQALTVQSAAWVPVLAMGDRARAAGRWLQQHPGIVFSAVVVVVVVRPRLVWRWSLRAWSAARFVRTLRSNLGGFGLY